MYTSVALAFALCSPGAPVPKDAPKAAVAGMAPRIVELKPNNEGKIVVQVRRTETIKAQQLPAGAAPRAVERTVSRISQVELSEVKDLKVMTAGGKSVELKEAIEKLKDGGIVVMTSDGKPVDVAFLRVLKDDTLVFTSPELVVGGSSSFTTIGGGGVIRPLPAPLPINPGNGAAPGIQIQILPGLIEVEAPAAPEKK